MQSSALESRTTEGEPERTCGRRSQFEGRMDILRAVGEGPIGPTRLIFKANLAWRPLQNHLKPLIDKGLLSVVSDHDRARYELTPKSFMTLDTYSNLLDAVGKQTLGERVW